MNFHEALAVASMGPCWIGFYFGRVEKGSLHLDSPSGNWYFIKNYRQFVERGRSIDIEVSKHNAELVSLDMIRLCDGPLKPLQDGESQVTVTDYDETILVVLGAGASYDFNDYLKPGGLKLPLTHQIFSDEHSTILDRYASASNLANSLIEVQDLELFFQRKWNMLTRSHNLELMRKLISAQYFMQELFWQYSICGDFVKPNFYAALIEQMMDYVALRNRRVKFLVVNFNYDTLFEDQLQKLKGYQFNDISDYDDPERDILVFKLHGSSNWCRYKTQSNKYLHPVTSAEISNTIELTLVDLSDLLSQYEPRIEVMTEQRGHFIQNARNNGQIELLRKMKGLVQRDMKFELITKTDFFPHMLIPYKDKDEFLIPKSQGSRLETMLDKCKRMYAIGWKGNEKKFIELLENRELRVSWITGRNGHREILEGEAKRLINAQHTYYTEGFAHCMKYVNSNMDNMFEKRDGIGVNHG